ncbi:DivIVA domain-containing protein [Mycobacteroides abscessus]|uniref:DivIVA domain-containing protein n=1 Tax=Mycobacteroides abscessus TaxID=36809 RepID=UPI00092B7426|nr:DivIVA domain-containing protein [Mycobacteroides abscessus]SHP81319.1 coiled-coil structural protein [Mycobacteroides abscessus subsp. bolletii]SHS07808.1 coiled-coil structural protein [Mycobacteroides abscessus subsp. bolletii]SHS95851.1 coiled-coil structural protein [Mycobacteroides abscessus subsp. bolletii]SKF66716.1 coiled-coil structural protein [Mycobacteroides abscessus subsp. bolletii]SKG21675.1 coiled-coil structural protein [Mycobacteroides abscessus subsp. bolletii]
MTTTTLNESTRNFTRTRNGYDPIEVNEYISRLTIMHQSGLNDVETLKGRLADATKQISSLKDEVTTLSDTSPSAHAMTDRMAKMLRIAVDEVAEMQNEARTESAALIASAKAMRTKHKEMLADMAARQSALETEYTEVMARAREEANQIVAQAVSESERLRAAEAKRREKAETELDEELTKLRTDTQTAVDEQRRSTQGECEKRLADAKDEADRRLRLADEQIERRLDQARRSVEEIGQQRISILEQLMGVHGRLESIPSALESAYRDRDNSKSIVMVPSKRVLDQKVIEG